MELRDLKTFVTVASLLSFNQAGQALHAAQSTISVRVRALEEELGVRLFDRLGRRVLLTEAGERLLAYGRKMVDLEEEARSWVAGDAGRHGTISVRVPETLCVLRLPGVLRRFREACPHSRVRLLPCAFEGLAEDLRRGVTDLAFVLANEVLARDLAAEFLGVEELVLAVAPDDPLAGRADVGPKDIAGQPLLLSTADCSYRRILEGMLAQAGSDPLAAVECGSVEAVKRFAAEGLGLTILPESLARAELAAGTLAAVDWAEGPLEAAVFMLHHKDKWISPTLAAFMDICRRELLPGDGRA
ncbi:LysR family transcriptional regulator [Desulfovibrio aminophilus]|nr:LysR family transcriptional regulator [Desulfovibrio aminophilus]MCM0755246.1 LysR family transcriptional regulator [Desulfovibrio aminophilus]